MICICGPWDEETYHPKDINKACPVHGEHPVNGMKEGPAHLGPECCGGGDFYGHESFCDCGHVAYEKDMLRKKEATDLVLLCAQDIVDGWPTLTFRTIGNMTKKIDTLKQALDAVKK
jgi:hypothetical protein